MTTRKRTKDRQYNDHNKKERTDNTMTTRKRTKDRQYNDHKKKDEEQTIQ